MALIMGLYTEYYGYVITITNFMATAKKNNIHVMI